MSRLLEYADQQLIGFAHARHGYDIVSLVDEMGLKLEEWEELKQRGTLPLHDSDIQSIDQYFDANPL
jgi:hypothetical protein